MNARLTTDDDATELDRRQILAVRDGVVETMRTQLSTHQGGPAILDLLLERLGDEGLKNLLTDIAGNIVQTLL